MESFQNSVVVRLMPLVVAVFLVAAACGSGEDVGSQTTSAVGAAPVTTTPQTTATVATAPPTTSPVTTTPVGASDCPEVIAVELSEVEAGIFNVSATVRSIDVEGVSYADAWEVRDLDGAVLGVRVLTHPHADEQPFTRSLANVEIPVDVLEVEVAAQDSVRGFCGMGLVVTVPHS